MLVTYLFRIITFYWNDPLSLHNGHLYLFLLLLKSDVHMATLPFF